MMVLLFSFGCDTTKKENFEEERWVLSALPSSVRLDPVSNTIIEHRFSAVESFKAPTHNLLEKNWIYDGEKIELYAARGEYISFQLVLTNNTDSILKGIMVDMKSFKSKEAQFEIKPELFLEWSVEVKTPTTGYPKASLGTGWYPDALIPYGLIQSDSAQVERRWTYPLELPDFNNRIDDQKSMVIWVDQFIPFENTKAKAGDYKSSISVKIDGEIKEIPITLHVWDFAIPNENKLKASLHHGILSRMEEEEALEIYQLFKRNRIGIMDPTYKPDVINSENNEFEIDWTSFDMELEKYFTGKAFTKEMGYPHGPGYGEPIEVFILPFDVYGKHGGAGWPDIGKTDVERNPENKAKYVEVIKMFRKHLSPMIDPEKTDITIYLNGLDESYFPEAWSRMAYYGDLFKEYYPEGHFRIDGGYSEEAMKIVQKSIKAWASHTINYEYDVMKKYQEKGIEDWIYGPMLYESKVNSWVGSSTFIDLPLINDRAISWASWKYHSYSWISWGATAGWKAAWYDPETWKDTYKHGSDSDDGFTFKKTNGNGQLIYSPGIVPNVDAACPSIRLKAIRNGVQEYEYMRLLTTRDGNRERADSVVNNIIKEPFGKKSIGNLDVWSFDAAQWDKARIALGELINQENNK